MSELTAEQWQNLIEEYYNENGIDEDNIHEWVDNLTPVHFSQIVKQFNAFNYEITEEDVGLEIWKVMTRSIYYELHYKFTTKLHEYSDNVDEEDEEE